MLERDKAARRKSAELGCCWRSLREAACLAEAVDLRRQLCLSVDCVQREKETSGSLKPSIALKEFAKGNGHSKWSTSTNFIYYYFLYFFSLPAPACFSKDGLSRCT